jgi:hypothetical protein
MSDRADEIIAAESVEALALNLVALAEHQGAPEYAQLADDLRQLSVRYQAGKIDGAALAAEARRIGERAAVLARKDPE